mgnify:CR=1 FL=1
MFEIREKPEMVERAMLVSIYFDPSEAGEKQAMLDELEDLVSNLGIGISPHPSRGNGNGLLTNASLTVKRSFWTSLPGAPGHGKPPCRWNWPACSIPCRAWPACGTT